MKRLPDCALKAVQVRYDHVNGHYCLGVAMARLGYYERAAAALGSSVVARSRPPQSAALPDQAQG